MLWLYTKVQALRATRDRGATAAEYALLVALVAAALAVVVGLFRGAIEGALSDVCDALDGGSNGCSP